MKKKSIPLITLSIILLTLFSLTHPPHTFALDFHEKNDQFDVDIKIRPSIGYRQDSLVWNIAGDINGENPNILSELEYNDMVIHQVGLNAHIHVNRVYLRSSLYYGEITSGECIDSDYHEDDRSDMFSESKSEINDDDTFDLDAGIGYVFGFFRERLQIIPLLGLAYHEQNLRVTNGTQTFGTADLSGLNSTYQAEWQSMWAGVDLIVAITKSFAMSLSGEYHDADYEAEADWNLRQDFQHPVSFVHSATGEGITLKAGIETIVNRHWTISLNYIQQDWSTHSGMDKVFFSDGTTSTTRLNEVNWKSEAMNLSVGYRF